MDTGFGVGSGAIPRMCTMAQTYRSHSHSQLSVADVWAYPVGSMVNSPTMNIHRCQELLFKQSLLWWRTPNGEPTGERDPEWSP